MIPRYSRPEMSQIWEPENKFRIWFEIEAHACDALAELGVIPKEAAAAIWERGRFEVERIDEIERETKHDVIAFLTNVAEHVGSEARFLHQGMPSSDVLDTALNIQLVEVFLSPVALIKKIAAIKPQKLDFFDDPVLTKLLTNKSFNYYRRLHVIANMHCCKNF